MSKRFLGIISPFLVTVLVLGLMIIISPRPSIKWGIGWGLGLALLQSFASIGAMSWAWKKTYFYWVWGGGVLFRLVVFGATAFVVYQYTNLHMLATLLTMVSATTLFLVFETAFLPNKV